MLCENKITKTLDCQKCTHCVHKQEHKFIIERLQEIREASFTVREPSEKVSFTLLYISIFIMTILTNIHLWLK